jgi:hypothetical protein
MKILTMSAVAAGLMMAGPAMTSAQTAAPSGPAPAAGETSDRTPGTKTETPLSQRDKTTPAPAGSTAAPPKPGTTSDRTPDGTSDDGAGRSAAGDDDASAKGKTTTGDDMKTPGKY